jgi:hypothetical protein
MMSKCWLSRATNSAVIGAARISSSRTNKDIVEPLMPPDCGCQVFDIAFGEACP